MLTTFEKVLLLQDVAFFSAVQSEHLAQLAAVSRDLEASRGSFLFREGDPSGLLYFLVSGKIQLECDSGVPWEFAGNTLEPWAFFSGSPHKFSARVLEPSRLLAVTHEDFLNLMIAEPEFSVAVLKHLAVQGLEEIVRKRAG